jgi:hypothetical protein
VPAAAAPVLTQVMIANVIPTSLTAKKVEMFCGQVNLPFAGPAARLNIFSTTLLKVCAMLEHSI